MDRRQTLKLLLLAGVGSGRGLSAAQTDSFESAFDRWPDMRWAGPDFWGNRLQDWEVKDGLLECRVRAPRRTLHCLTRRIEDAPFEIEVDLVLSSGTTPGFAGFRVGVRGRLDDHRSAAVHGEGWDAAITTGGRLRLGEAEGSETIALDQPIRLRLRATDGALELTAHDPETGAMLAQLSSAARPNLAGNAALVSHFDGDEGAPGATFSRFQLRGEGVVSDPAARFGPIYFAQYTVHRGVVKLTAQLAPVEGAASLETRPANGPWATVAEATIDPLSHTARFRVENWNSSEAVHYRVILRMPLRGGDERFTYEGTIAAEPTAEEPLKLAVFSCNADHGFPDGEVVDTVSKHEAHLAFFLGDQYYESTGGFGIQTSPLADACLDVLHRWAMFGWSYRELFRHIPSACLADDHDVYHGNIWGEGGKRAPTDAGWSADQGGYKMPAQWLNAMQRMQTSHLPDPYDEASVEQGITVYYTAWQYGGIDFALLEDRKFKSAPQNALPPEAQVVNGWIRNPAFDITEHRDLPNASLLGERQMRFVDQWSREWSEDTAAKVVVSQTNFAAIHTIPSDAASGAVIPSLPIPAPGEYVTGDKKSVDLDSNGWPQNERDAVLGLLRRCRAFHIAGDQHLATVVRHGIERFDDAGFSFTGPALNNIWPRRWWPPVDSREQPLEGAPDYAGQFLDGLGNRVTVHAAANPRRTGLSPTIIRDRVTGYGIVTFDKASARIHMECWPRHVDPDTEPDGQYEGWPIEIGFDDGDGRRPSGLLPEIRVEGTTRAILEVIDPLGEVVSSRPLTSRNFRAPVFREGPHTIRVGNPATGQWQERREVRPTSSSASRLVFRFS